MASSYNHKYIYVIMSWIVLLVIPTYAYSQNNYSTFSFQFENDAFFNTDSQYSNGLFFTYITPLNISHENEKNNYLINFHNFVHTNDKYSQKSFSISIGQNIYTPDDTDNSELIKDDRPYAGLAYASIGFHDQSSYSSNTFELDFGLVGYHSYAEDTQNIIHDLLAWDQPQGWEHQLDDELFLGITYEKRWKLTNEGGNTGFGFELIPHIGGSIGNAFINAHSGTELRIGWNLPHDYGTARIRQGALATTNPGKLNPTYSTKFSRIGLHVYAAVDGEYSVRNILLDGNTFTDSHSVDKKPFVLTHMVGISFIISRYKLTYAHVYKTRQFDTQNNDLQYGSISFSCSF